MSLDEFIQRKMSAARVGLVGGERQSDTSCVAGVNLYTVSNGAAGVGGGPMRWSAVKRPYVFNPYSKGVAGTRWTRDTYRGLKNQQIRRGPSTTKSYKIFISNLGNGVTSADLQKLFCGFGWLKSAAVHFDESGTSLGTAGVDFGSKTSAINAVSYCNDLPLDGRPMKIKFTTTDLPNMTNLDTCLVRSVPKPARDSRGGGFQSYWGNTRVDHRNNRGITSERGGRGSRYSIKKMPTKDDLDKQLDDIIRKQKYTYTMNKYTNFLKLNPEFACMDDDKK